MPRIKVRPFVLAIMTAMGNWPCAVSGMSKIEFFECARGGLKLYDGAIVTRRKRRRIVYDGRERNLFATRKCSKGRSENCKGAVTTFL